MISTCMYNCRNSQAHSITIMDFVKKNMVSKCNESLICSDINRTVQTQKMAIRLENTNLGRRGVVL